MNAHDQTSPLSTTASLVGWQPALALLARSFPGWQFVFQFQGEAILLQGTHPGENRLGRVAVPPELLEWFPQASPATQRRLNSLLAQELRALIGQHYPVCAP